MLIGCYRHGCDRPGWNMGGEYHTLRQIYTDLYTDEAILINYSQLTILVWLGVLSQPLMLFTGHPVRTNDPHPTPNPMNHS